MAPLSTRLAMESCVDARICVTAQHRNMLDQVLEVFAISPDYDLDIMQHGQGLTHITSAVITSVEETLEVFLPDVVLVQGDTTTTFAASLAAFYKKIPVGHVEAGLRTGDIYAPWPEEMNRRLTSAIARVHFAPTQSAAENLMREGISPERILVTGNTVIDALLAVIKRVRTEPTLRAQFQEQFSFIDSSRKMILVTGHRRENFGKGFEGICNALNALSERNDVQIVYPVHMNPNVRGPVYRILGERTNVHLIEPVSYVPFVYLMDQSYFIITDSGGIQEEAPTLGKPVLVMRDTTERPEAVKSGTVRVIGTCSEAIVKAATELLDSVESYGLMSLAHNPYGDGTASERIVEGLLNEFA